MGFTVRRIELNRPGLVARAEVRFQSKGAPERDHCDVSHFLAAFTVSATFSCLYKHLASPKIGRRMACKSAYSLQHYTKAAAKANP
jgi:hypothetical protein